MESVSSYFRVITAGWDKSRPASPTTQFIYSGAQPENCHSAETNLNCWMQV